MLIYRLQKVWLCVVGVYHAWTQTLRSKGDVYTE